jgi:hypothetical protein
LVTQCRVKRRLTREKGKQYAKVGLMNQTLHKKNPYRGTKPSSLFLHLKGGLDKSSPYIRLEPGFDESNPYNRGG